MSAKLPDFLMAALDRACSSDYPPDWLCEEARQQLQFAIVTYGQRCATVAITACAKLCEDRRQRVLKNPDDPSRTEHFADLQDEMRALPLSITEGAS